MRSHDSGMINKRKNKNNYKGAKERKIKRMIRLRRRTRYRKHRRHKSFRRLIKTRKQGQSITKIKLRKCTQSKSQSTWRVMGK